MIKFQAYDDWELDLTDYGITFNEYSDIFYNETRKNFTFPLNVVLTSELAANFGLVNLENSTAYKIKIPGYLFIDREFFDAYLMINNVVDRTAQVQFYYGAEVLSVFDKRLTQLPFPVIEAPDFPAHFSEVIDAEYPTTGHNFPLVYRPQIAQIENYDKFASFVNNASIGGAVVTNFDVIEGPDTIIHNRNVVAPCPYILEMLRVGFASEGKEIRGEMVNDELVKKLVYIPKNYLENYANTSSRDFWRFEFADAQETIEGSTINVYQHTITPNSEGFFHLRVKVDFPAGIANYFDLKVEYGATELYTAFVENQALNIDTEITYEIPEGATVEDFVVTLKISEQTITIKHLASFLFYQDGGEVNIYPPEYSLTDFVPDMKFRTFFNAIKEWLALDVIYYENAVYLNYMNTSITQKVFEDHSDIEDPKKKRSLNKNNLFRLYYEEGTKLLVADSGRIYNEDDYTDSETTDIPFKVSPIKIGENKSRVTGVYPDDDKSLLIGMYNGRVGGYAVLADNVDDVDLSLESIEKRYHRKWLKFRANAEQYRDTFRAHIGKVFNLRNGIFKYNKLHLIKSLRKRRIGKKHYKVDCEMESF